MLTLPATFARSGIIPTIATLLFVCLLCALCSLHMANTISKLPRNDDFQQEVEFSEAFRSFWGNRWFLLSQVLFYCCVTCLNISSIVDTSQVVDTFFGHWMPYGGTAALLITSDAVTWVRWDYSICSEQDLIDGTCIPFSDDNGGLLTVGNLVTTAIFLPLALMDLKENSKWQVLGFLVLLVTSVQFVVQFATWPGLSLENTSWWGEDWGDLFGVVLFNFALVIAVPAWLYECEPHVDVPTVIHSSTILSAILYIAIGLLGSLAMPNVSENMLESMMSGTMGTFMQLSASVFAFFIIGLGIPLFSVLVRLNLTSKGMCSRGVGNLFAVYIPFAASWLLHDGTAITKLLSWGGMIFTSLVAFILPLVLALHATKDYDADGSIDVYFGCFKGRDAQLLSLRIILALAVLAIAAAVGGNIWDTAT
jgi:amino acid permease